MSREYKIREAVEDILKRKSLRKGELCNRIGVKPQYLYAWLKSNNPTLDKLGEICNGLGVEICIIDGWKKYRLNEMNGNTDLDLMIDEMRSSFGGEQSEDRWQEQRDEIERLKEEKRARARAYAEKYNTRERVKARNERKRGEDLALKGDVCLHCAKCDPRLERGFRHWCKGTEKYEARVRCKFFIQKDM